MGSFYSNLSLIPTDWVKLLKVYWSLDHFGLLDMIWIVRIRNTVVIAGKMDTAYQRQFCSGNWSWWRDRD